MGFKHKSIVNPSKEQEASEGGIDGHRSAVKRESPFARKWFLIPQLVFWKGHKRELVFREWLLIPLNKQHVAAGRKRIPLFGQVFLELHVHPKYM